MGLFESEDILAKLPQTIEHLSRRLADLGGNRWIRDIRQCGMIAGIEVGQPDGAAFDPRERIGMRVCVAARKYQLLTRPILDTIVFMPPLCVSNAEIDLALEAIERAVEEVCGA